MGTAAPCCMAGEEQAVEVFLLLREVYGEATAVALQKIADLLGCLEASYGGTATTAAYPALLNIAMILKQVDDSRRYRTPPLSGKKFEDRAVLRRAARCAKFVSAACMKGREAVASYVGDLQPDDIRCLVAPSGPKAPGYLVAVDHACDEIMLCIHHSECQTETELDCVLSPLSGGRAQPEMLECARSVVLAATNIIASLALEFPRKGIVITGHGAAAGTAALALVMLCGEGCPLREAVHAGRVLCYTFGPPPIFEPLWALPAHVRASIYSFIHGMDYVPRLCLASLSRLLVAVRQVDRLPLTGLQRMGYLRGRLDMDYRLPDVVIAYGERPEGSLSVVGTVVLLYKSEKSIFQCERMTSALCDQLLLHRDMVNDHLMPLYEQVTADVGLTSEVY